MRYYNSAEELGGWHASTFFFLASSGSHSRTECIAFTLGETRKAITRLKGFGSS